MKTVDCLMTKLNKSMTQEIKWNVAKKQYLCCKL